MRHQAELSWGLSDEGQGDHGGKGVPGGATAASSPFTAFFLVFLFFLPIIAAACLWFSMIFFCIQLVCCSFRLRLSARTNNQYSPSWGGFFFFPNTDPRASGQVKGHTWRHLLNVFGRLVSLVRLWFHRLEMKSSQSPNLTLTRAPPAAPPPPPLTFRTSSWSFHSFSSFLLSVVLPFSLVTVVWMSVKNEIKHFWLDYWRGILNIPVYN